MPWGTSSVRAPRLFHSLAGVDTPGTTLTGREAWVEGALVSVKCLGCPEAAVAVAMFRETRATSARRTWGNWGCGGSAKDSECSHMSGRGKQGEWAELAWERGEMRGMWRP